MGQITCDVCGSHEFLKQSGVYKCKSCGMEYSLSEIRALFTETSIVKGESDAEIQAIFDTGTSGTVKETNSSNDDMLTEQFLRLADNQLSRRERRKLLKEYRKIEKMRARNNKDNSISGTIIRLAPLIAFIAFWFFVAMIAMKH